MKDCIGEIWKPINRTNKNYYISNFGRVYSLKSNKIMKTPVDGRGYINCNIRVEGKTINIKIHRVVAEHFIPNYLNKREVNHIDGDKTNSRVDNLEWVTPRENLQHARITGLHTSDGDKAVNQIKNGIIINTFKSISEASRMTGINRSNVNQCCLKRSRYKTAGGYEWDYAK